jgi:hypothetical protein
LARRILRGSRDAYEGPELSRPSELLETLLLHQEQLGADFEHEKERLRDVLGAAFDNCGDWMGAFVIGQILGEHYPDEVTLAILARLAKTANLLNMQLLPHALDHLARATDCESLRSQAIQQLQELGKSASVEVRDEAFTSLARLGIKAE